MGGSHPQTLIAVLVDPGSIRVGALLSLDPAEVHHLEVRRAQSGDQVRLLDGQGAVGVGTVSLGRREARVEVREGRKLESPAPLVLGVGGGDRERFGWMVEKCAELGVSAIVPLITERSAHVGNRVRADHVEKLGRRALEAIKQSGNPFAPTVQQPATLPEFNRRALQGLRILADQGGDLMPALTASTAVSVAVGPEGGWSEAELQVLRQAGFAPVRLSEHTLRFETAAIAAAVQVQLTRTA